MGKEPDPPSSSEPGRRSQGSGGKVARQPISRDGCFWWISLAPFLTESATLRAFLEIPPTIFAPAWKFFGAVPHLDSVRSIFSRIHSLPQDYYRPGEGNRPTCGKSLGDGRFSGSFSLAGSEGGHSENLFEPQSHDRENHGRPRKDASANRAVKEEQSRPGSGSTRPCTIGKTCRSGTVGRGGGSRDR